MMRAGIPAMLLATAAVLAVTAGCSSASSAGAAGGTASSTGSAASPTAASTSTGGASTGGGAAASGVATPQQVVTGLIQDELAGHWSKLCSYFPPGKRPGCSSAGSLSGKPTGKLTVDGAVISGTRALVKVTGHICLSGKSDCQGNTDPEAGLPSGSETFLQAYDKAVAGGAFSPLPCIKVKGRWYVNGSP